MNFSKNQDMELVDIFNFCSSVRRSVIVVLG